MTPQFARRVIAGAVFFAIANGPQIGAAQLLCDATGDGIIDVTDGVQVLRAAVGLPSSCTVAACDADGDGAITVTDGVNALRAAASLASSCDRGTPAPTPTPAPDTVRACDDDCRTSLRLCGDQVFHDDFASIQECTDDCVETVDEFAADAPNAAGCVDAQVRFIDCCTAKGSCGQIPERCDSEFNNAASACSGEFGGCPLLFFGE